MIYGNHRILTGDWRSVAPTLPIKHFHCVVTSPPYYAKQLFSWGGAQTCGHAWPSVIPFDQGWMECSRCGCRAGTLGLEPTVDDYVRAMVGVCRHVWRVLRDDGTLWLNLGDSIVDKNWIGVPWRVAFALQKDGWIVRDAVVWDKMRPVPGSQQDRCTTSYELVFLLTKKKETYFFDLAAIREQQAYDGLVPSAEEMAVGTNNDPGLPGRIRGGVPACVSPGGRTPRNVWRIAPVSGRSPDVSEGHYAKFPRELPSRCIKAGTSEGGCCSVCGRARDRIVDGGRTVGWSKPCVCAGMVVPCRVLDPFSGHGTSGIAACLLGRDYVGCEISDVYARRSVSRIEQALRPGTFVDEESTAPPAPLFEEVT